MPAIYESVRTLGEELAKFTGLVVGSNGKGGSGTCIQLEDGTIALLTAKHVVIECLRNTGKVLIAVYGDEFQEPQLIRMDSSSQGDAAYLIFSNLPSYTKAVPFEEWTNNRSDIELDQCVWACGFPSAAKKVNGRKLKSAFFWVGNKILEIRGDRIVSGFDKMIEGIPHTFHGLSGGGLFSNDGRFIGIIVEENRNTPSQYGELYSIIPSEFTELYKGFSIPPNAPTGEYFKEERSVSLELQKPDGSGIQAIVGGRAEFFWSKSNPSHEYGRIGRIISLEFIIPGIDMHYPININSTFTWLVDSEEDRLNAMYEELKYLLLRIGWLVQEEGSEGAIIQVNPMI